VKLLLLLGYIAYFVYAMIYRFGDEGSIRLLSVTIVVFSGYFYYKLSSIFGARIVNFCNHLRICKVVRFHVTKRCHIIER